MPGNIQPITFEQQQARYRYPLTPAELPQGETPLRYSNFILTKTGTAIVETTQYNQVQVVVPAQLPLTQPLYEQALRQPSPFPYPVTQLPQGSVSLTPQVPVTPEPVIDEAVQSPAIAANTSTSIDDPLTLNLPLVSETTSAAVVTPSLALTTPTLIPTVKTPIVTDNLAALPSQEPLPSPSLERTVPTPSLPLASPPPAFDSQQWARQLDGRVIAQHPMTLPVPWGRPAQSTARGGASREQSGGALGERPFSPFQTPMAMASPQGGPSQGKPDLMNPALYKRLAPNNGGWQA